MARSNGVKDITPLNREKMKCIIRPRLKYRDTHAELLLRLEDNDLEISEPTLGIILREIRGELKERFKAIGEYELAEEHNYAIEMMKDLMGTMKNSLGRCKDERERVVVVNQIQSLQKDLIDYYGRTDIVENVFKYFNEEEQEKTEEKVQQVRTKVKKKPKKKEMLTEF